MLGQPCRKPPDCSGQDGGLRMPSNLDGGRLHWLMRRVGPMTVLGPWESRLRIHNGASVWLARDSVAGLSPTPERSTPCRRGLDRSPGAPLALLSWAARAAVGRHPGADAFLDSVGRRL